jgi:hypothetical protein
MRHVSAKTRALLGVGVLCATIGVLVLALAGVGTAAGKNICTVGSSPANPAASCVGEVSSPHFLSTGGGDATSGTTFTNEAGPGGATATHVVLSVQFSSPVTVDAIALAVNGSSTGTSGCATNTTSVSCPVGNIAGGGNAKLRVRFTTTTSQTLTGSVSYGEGGGTPGQPPNSVQSNFDTLIVSGDNSVQGGCFDLSGTQTQTVTGTNTSPFTQTTQAVVGQGDGVLCTFADAGVDGNAAHSALALKSQIAFFEFPTLASGFSTVNMIFPSLPPGSPPLNQIKILEDTSYALPFFRTYITVPSCVNGSIPAPIGVPVKGATDSVPHSNDLCMLKPTNKGGVSTFTFVAFGSPGDGHLGF